MRDVIDLLHAYLSGHDSSLAATFRKELYDSRRHPVLPWFCRQFHVRLSSNADWILIYFITADRQGNFTPCKHSQ